MSTLLLFTAEWCGACDPQKDILDSFEEDNPSVDVEYVDVDEETERANKYGIRSLPTTIILDDDGTVVKQFNGLVQQNDIESRIE